MTSRPAGKVTYDNAGRVVLVTGGCSGIGWAVCQAFRETGAEVVCVDVDAEKAATLPGGVHFRHADTSVDTDCQQAAQWTLQHCGGLDVLVNNAAIQLMDSYRPIDEYSPEMWDRMVAVNLTGYTHMARHVLPIMRRQGSGVIINMASGQGHRTTRGSPAYGPIKAANIMQARQWGVEYAREGIRVISISPGAIDTPLVRSTLAAQGGEQELANRHPIGRIGQPQEVAHAAVWLASQDASFITATDLEIDGGLGAFGAFADPFPKS